MIMNLTRKWYTPDCTIGTLLIDTIPGFSCFTLEPKTRVKELVNFTAIPAGTYPVIINDSPHFGRPMPLVENVMGYEGIRIHNGNTDVDTEGCVLVGQYRAILPNGEDEIWNCQPVFDIIFNELQKTLNAGGSASLVITDTYAPIEALTDKNFYKPNAEV